MSPQNAARPGDLGNFMSKLRANLDRIDTDPEFRKELTSPRQGNPITLGPVVKSAKDWADKQIKNAANAAQEWFENVQHPRRDPIKAAIAAAPKREQKVRESLDQKKWDKAMAKVDEDGMYETIRKRGPSAFRSGVEDRAGKIHKVVEELQPMVATLSQEIQSMPDVSDTDRENRLLAGRRGMIQIGKKRRGIS